MKALVKPKIDHPGKLAVAGLLALIAAYIFASLAIDSGSWLQYGLAIVGIYFGMAYIVHAIKALRK